MSAPCENGNGNVIAIQNVNHHTLGARVVALMVGTTSVEGMAGAEDEVRMDLDVVSLAAGSREEDSGTSTDTNTSTSSHTNSHTNTNISTSSNINTNTNNRNHNRMHHSSSSSSSNSNSSRLHPLLGRHQIKLFNLCNHLPHLRGLRPMSVNIFPHRFSNRTCRMGLTHIKHRFRFRILHLLMQA